LSCRYAYQLKYVVAGLSYILRNVQLCALLRLNNIILLAYNAYRASLLMLGVCFFIALNVT